MFELIFEGETVAEIPIETVKSNMQALFKASPAQINVMFSGQRVVLKNKLDKPTALKYQAVMKKQGAVCRIALTASAAKPAAQPAQQATPQTPQKSPPAAQKPVSPVPNKAAPKEKTAPPISPTEETPQFTTQIGAAPTKANFSTQQPATETGRLQVAGEEVDTILSGKEVGIAPTGTTLGEEKHVDAPIFEHIDDIDVAPAGEDLSEHEDLPPPPAPDVSHISVAPTGSDMGEKKKDEAVKVPDISHIKLE